MPTLKLSFESREDSLSVSRFSVHEAISTLFTVSVWAVSPNPNVALDEIVGKAAGLKVVGGWKYAALGGTRYWTGICSSIEQVRIEPGGLSTYRLTIVPTLWLLIHRQDYRIFQYFNVPDIVDRILSAWGIKPVWHIDRGHYERLEYRVQYGESDYAFLCRLLEEAGIAFTFPEDAEAGSRLTLGDRLHGMTPRASPPLPYVDNPNQEAEKEFVTEVALGHEVRPGAHTLRGQDFRRPDLFPTGEAPPAKAPESRYEQYHYDPGALLIEMRGKSREHVHADDRGVARYDPDWGAAQAARALEALRSDRRTVTFATNTIDLWPGAIFSIDGHPRSEVGGGSLLVTEFTCTGSPHEEWSMRGRAVFTDVPYRPPQHTRKPKGVSVQSAIVVGPSGQEIHTDEFGRVRVQLPWDRIGSQNEGSSCWMRVSQGWAGTGYGLFQVPRVGQEVLVGFMDSDIDQPVVVGRVHNLTNPVPYKLPENKTRAGWKSDVSPDALGYNEIYFEDLAGNELVSIQAQRRLRALVKNDETITVGNNREKTVALNETDTTVANRTEVTLLDRSETVDMHRSTMIASSLYKLVRGNEEERNEKDQVIRVGKNHEAITRGEKRALVEIDDHAWIKKDRSERVDQTFSLSIGVDLQEKIGGSHATEAAAEIHLKAGGAVVGEAPDITVKGLGGFLRIDATGVVISGTQVKINTGGSAGGGAGSHVRRAALARFANAAKHHPWDKECILKILCSQDKAVIEQLAKTKLEVSDKITFKDPYFNGTRWTTKVFTAGGVSSAADATIGLLSGSSCDEAATTIFHEIWHQNQDASMSFAESEYDAYTVTEEWTLQHGFPSQGDPNVMRTKDANGKVVPNVPGIRKFVHDHYPVAPPDSEQVVGKAKNGDTLVSNGKKTWRRKPQRGDTYPGPMKVKGHRVVDTAGWKC